MVTAAQKRAIRTLFSEQQLIPEDARGERTKRLVSAITARLTRSGRPEEIASYVAGRVVEALGIKMDSKRPAETSYLVFVGSGEIEQLADIASSHWDGLAAGFDPGDKKAKKPELPKNVASQARTAIDGRRAVDIALFGRMLADLPDRNRDAAAQIAHALSVNRVEVEFDFFTAVDDLKDASQIHEDSGAGMLGTIEFNSACFYRYFNVDLDQLSVNLGGDRALVESALRAYLRASVMALPTGKQNSFAAHQAPSFIHTVVRERGLQSLANAFVRPVSAMPGEDLVEKSVSALDNYLGRLTEMYGDAESTRRVVCLDSAYGGKLANLKHAQVAAFETLIEQTVAAALPA